MALYIFWLVNCPTRPGQDGSHEESPELSYYESVFIARPDISASQVEALTEAFKAIIGDNGGTVGKTEYWGLKTLAYRIKKNRKGHYSLMNVDAPAAAVAELERNMRLNEDVLRYMTIRVDELEEEPSIVMRSKGSRDDRGRRDDRGPRGDRGPRSDRGPRDDRGPRGDRGPRAEPAKTEEPSGAAPADAAPAKDETEGAGA